MGRTNMKIYNTPWGFKNSTLIISLYTIIGASTIPILWELPHYWVEFSLYFSMLLVIFIMFCGHLAVTHIYEDGIISKVYGIKVCFIPWGEVQHIILFNGFSGKSALGRLDYSFYLILSRGEISLKDCHFLTYKKRRQILIRLSKETAEQIISIINSRLSTNIDANKASTKVNRTHCKAIVVDQIKVGEVANRE